ncbi:hypothetical protein ACFOWA_16005 [Pedobacter lithocola]|uniref:Uncharacterized protein n=1 Tax=Pedobacter lithocola TaxID=1908239 RepID=A0ABV8PEL6_9SPHI
MPVEDPSFLGSFIFFWGQKQETTHTWFSLFDEYGNKTEAVSVAEEIWKGKTLNFRGPKIINIFLSGKVAPDNIFLDPDELQSAEIKVLQNTSGFSVIWEIYPEDWFKKNNVNNLIKPKILKGLIIQQSGFKVRFKTPTAEGPYRLFSTVLDNKGNIATANIPFYVIRSHE